MGRGILKNPVIPANAGIQESMARMSIWNDIHTLIFWSEDKERVVASSRSSGRLDSGLAGGPAPRSVLGNDGLLQRMAIIIFLLLSTLFCSIAFGADAAATAPVPAAASYSPAGQIMKMIIGLMVVLVMIFVVAWVARNYMGFNPAQNATLKTVAGVLVGQKERVVLVQVGERQVLIGVAPGQINLLHVIEKGEEVTVAAQQSLSPFAEKLKRSLGRIEKS